MRKKQILFLPAALLSVLFLLGFWRFLSVSAVCDHKNERLTYLAPTCTDAGKEVLICMRCGEITERTEPALGHDFALTWEVDKEPTCSEKGQKSRHCSRCSAITSVVSLVPLNHNFSTITVAPTCTDTGYRLRTCVRCGFQTKDQYKDALGHTAGPWVTEQAPTCTEKGVRIAHCTVCGAVAAQSSVAAAGHSYRETTLAPTCTEKGYTLRTCSRCGAETKSNTVKALGHDYPATGIVTKAPGCTEKGEETLYCTRCGAPKIRTLSALGHNYDAQWTVDKAPTCTAQGEKSHRCSRCAKRSDVTAIPRADHTPVADSAVAPTCEAKGKEGGAHCRDCGKVLAAPTQTAALGHAFSNTGVLKEATCTQPGSVGRVCARCGKTEEAATDALGHSYDTQWTIDQAATCTAKGEQSHHCIRCGKRKDVTEIPRKEHVEVVDPVLAPTCTEKGKSAGVHCRDCGKTLIAPTDLPAKGHDFQIIATETEPTCTEKGRALMACSVCALTETQNVAALGHSYDAAWTVDKAPSCTAQGEQSHHCARCGKRTDVTALPRTAHVPVYEGLIAPTCTERGRANRAYCADCGKTLSEKTTLPANGHTEKTTVKKATTQKNGSALTVCTVCGETLKKERIARIKSVALSAKSFAYNGEKKKPSVTLKDKDGKTLKTADCCKVSYDTDRTSIGVHTVKITFCGNYRGSATRTFSIVPRKVTGLRFTSTQDTVSLTWNTVEGASGYKVYLYNAQTKQYTLLKKTKTNAFSMRKLLPGTVYLFCVRAYAVCGDKVLCGKRSANKATATRPLTPSVTAQVQNRKAVLSWQSCGDCTYEICASDKRNGAFVLLGTTASTSFVTEEFPAGSRKFFKVRAISGQQTAESSKLVALQF